MKRFALMAAVLAVLTIGVHAQDAARLFRTAINTEMVDGDLKAAIEQYKKVAEGTDRTLAAQALARMAACYEKLGQSDALATYQRIVRDFTDVKEVSDAAREKLAAARAPQGQTDGLALRRLVTIDTGVFSLSADGALIVGRDGSNLVVRDTASGRPAILVAGTPLAEAAPAVAFSPDRRQVAYRWTERSQSGAPRESSLRTIGTEPGARPRTLLAPDANIDSVSPVGWSSDGSAVIVMIARRNPATQFLASVAVADGAMRTLRSFIPQQTLSAPRLSPDGRYLVYSRAIAGGSPARHIFIARVDQSDEADVVKLAGANTQPVWTPDGTRILFVSDRTGVKALWSVAINDGKAVGEPSILQRQFTGTPLAVSQSGALYYAQQDGGGSANIIAERSQSGARVVATFIGGGVHWSPDGKSLAYLRQLDMAGTDWLSRPEMFVREFESGVERAYRHERIGTAGPLWLGAGGFLVNLNDDGPESGRLVAFVDVKTGEFKPILARQTAELDRSLNVPSKDGTRIYMVVRKKGSGNPWTGIVTVNVSTGTQESMITLPRPLTTNMVPGMALSPDGTVLAVMAQDGDGSNPRARLFTIGIDGTGYREIYGPFPVDRTPNLVKWTPDDQVLFVTNQGGVRRVLRIPASGGRPEPDGFETSNFIRSIDPSPDGTRIAVNYDVPVASELWALDNVTSALASRR